MKNPFLIGRDNNIFSAHDGLGFVVHAGDFVGKDSFMNRDEAIRRCKERPEEIVILNMGDSSTSGWHSDSLSREGNNKSTDPYFHYKTYSDIMRDTFENTFNAGVSKYSSFQGAKYLALLLRELSKHEVYPDYVTLYFGNNDSVYSEVEDKSALDGMLPSEEHTSQRVTLPDFEHNISEMIRLSRGYGAQPLIIVPLRRYDWAPGLRSMRHSDEYDKGLHQLSSEKLRNELQKARELYLEGKVEEAYEQDIFLPRIKERYVQALRKIAKKQRVDIIDLQKDTSLFQGSQFFCDYCHPLEPANTLIFQEFLKVVDKPSQKSMRRTNSIFSRYSPPEDIYPLW